MHYPIDRRTFLVASGLSCFGLNIAGAAPARRAAKSTIMIWLSGGASHIDTWDLKPDAVAEYRGQGGTWIIPGRGRLSDTADVASYRNMVTIIRDRVKDQIGRGLTLQQVKAARPTMDFDGRYATAAAGSWTADSFVEAVYRSLQEKK